MEWRERPECDDDGSAGGGRLRDRWRERDETMPVRGTAIRQQAEDAVRRELEPGERILAGAAVASGPSRWNGAWVIAVSLALVAEALVGLFGPAPSLLSGGLVAVIAVGLPLLAMYLACRPMYIAVSDTRLIGLRLSRHAGTPRRVAFDGMLGEVRITNQRYGRYGGSVRCEIRGQKKTRLNVERSCYPEFAGVTAELRRCGALTEWDRPPYSPANS
jgi:hypothetical protein